MPAGSQHDPLLLTRFFYGSDFTLGVLELPSGRSIYTVEDGWHGNAVGLSCIPDGLYRCTPRPFYRGNYPAWEVRDVPGRTTILFHKANTALDVTGCIAVGEQIRAFGDTVGVARSAQAFAEMHRQLDGLPDWWVRVMPFGSLPGTGG